MFPNNCRRQGSLPSTESVTMATASVSQHYSNRRLTLTSGTMSVTKNNFSQSHKNIPVVSTILYILVIHVPTLLSTEGLTIRF